MRFISVQNGRLIDTSRTRVAGRAGFRTRCAALNALAPGGCFARAAVHELLVPVDRPPTLAPAMLLASSAAERGLVVVLDPDGSFHPPALLDWEIPLERLLLVRPTGAGQAVRATAEALRCPAVDCVVATLEGLSRVESRQLQLSAETGGGVGVLLRPDDRRAVEHAAVTRWRVLPTPGTRLLHRWKMQLVHGHGGRVGQVVVVEHGREAHLLRATAELADRPSASAAESRRRA